MLNTYSTLIYNYRRLCIIYLVLYISSTHSVYIFVRLFVCPIITRESLDRFASNFDRESRENHVNVLS